MSAAGSDSPASNGSTATATRPAMRATALLTPLATPDRAGPTAASTVVVSGATVSASPRPGSAEVGGSRADSGQQKQSGTRQERTDRHWQPRPGPRRECTGAGGQQEQQQRYRQQGCARGQCRVVQHPLEFEHDEEQRPA